MKPGSELDALVAEKVMGLERVMTPGFGMEVGWRPIHSNLGASPLKSYSTDISAAWEVVEKMKQINLLRVGSTLSLSRNS